MKIVSDAFRVRPRKKLRLSRIPTSVPAFCGTRKLYHKRLKHHVHELSALQQLHYASGRNALLLIFQGMDASGKDSAIRHVMSGVNPQGCEVFSFKEPSAEELRHDFLWRSNCRLPERGRIGIFNRSYYEEVLVVRVHPDLLPAGTPRRDLSVWKERCRSIVDLERHLGKCGTRVIKFFLHLSKQEQRRRFKDRLENTDKNWKLSVSDIKERQHWAKYVKVFEDCLEATSTSEAPWFIVPADDKDNARLIVSQVVLDTLRGMKMAYPPLDANRRAELKSMKEML